MLLRNLADVRDLFASAEGSLVGVGMTAFSRIIPAHFLDRYTIVCERRTRDLPFLRKTTDIFCVQEETPEPIRETDSNASMLLSHSAVRKFLGSLPRPTHLYLYQSYPELETAAKEEGWVLLANPASLRLPLTRRAFFKKLISDLRLPEIPGGIYPIAVFHERDYAFWVRLVGPDFVVQLPDLIQGGGRGTFFIHSGEDYRTLQGRLEESLWRGISLKTVSVGKYIDGIPVSTAVCVTRHGLLFSRLQRQLIDVSYCGRMIEKGIFCGHSWDERPWPEGVAAQARGQTWRIGQFLASLGYRGIMGIDFLMDKKDHTLYPVEINPRLTGAFPMLSRLHMEKGIIPMEVFHLLEFLGMPYELDICAMNAQYDQPVRGSHLLLFVLSPEEKLAGEGLEPGLYGRSSERDKFSRGEYSFLSEAMGFVDIRNKEQFIVIEGPPDTDGRVCSFSDPLYRLCRLLFSCSASEDCGALCQNADRAVKWAYKRILGRE